MQTQTLSATSTGPLSNQHSTCSFGGGCFLIRTSGRSLTLSPFRVFEACFSFFSLVLNYLALCPSRLSTTLIVSRSNAVSDEQARIHLLFNRCGCSPCCDMLRTIRSIMKRSPFIPFILWMLGLVCVAMLLSSCGTQSHHTSKFHPPKSHRACPAYY